MQTIFRSNPERHFTILPNDLLQSELSGRALGLLVKILSLPDDWKVQKQWLRGKDGREAIDSAFDELEAEGYMRRLKPTETQAGRFAPLSYQFTDTPGKFPTVDGFPYTVCRTRLTVDGNPTATKNTPLITQNKGPRTKEPKGAFQPTRDFPVDEDAMMETIENEIGYVLTGQADTIARNFYYDMEKAVWTIKGTTVIDWLKVLAARIEKQTGEDILSGYEKEDVIF
jgi:hypothetical protein